LRRESREKKGTSSTSLASNTRAVSLFGSTRGQSLTSRNAKRKGTWERMHRRQNLGHGLFKHVVGRKPTLIALRLRCRASGRDRKRTKGGVITTRRTNGVGDECLRRVEQIEVNFQPRRNSGPARQSTSGANRTPLARPEEGPKRGNSSAQKEAALPIAYQIHV